MSVPVCRVGSGDVITKKLCRQQSLRVFARSVTSELKISELVLCSRSASGDVITRKDLQRQFCSSWVLGLETTKQSIRGFWSMLVNYTGLT